VYHDNFNFRLWYIRKMNLFHRQSLTRLQIKSLTPINHSPPARERRNIPDKQIQMRPCQDNPPTWLNVPSNRGSPTHQLLPSFRMKGPYRSMKSRIIPTTRHCSSPRTSPVLSRLLQRCYDAANSRRDTNLHSVPVHRILLTPPLPVSEIPVKVVNYVFQLKWRVSRLPPCRLWTLLSWKWVFVFAGEDQSAAIRVVM